MRIPGCATLVPLAAALVLTCASLAPVGVVSPLPAAGAATGGLVHARVWTGDPKHPWAEAVAWQGERIVAVGTDAEIAKLLAPGVAPVDAAGAMAVPGFIDSHLHFISGGAALASIQLHDVTSKAAFVAAVAAYARDLRPGAWITGGRWDHTHWGGELPDRSWLDAVTPNNPVWVERVDGHMALANGAALRAAGVTRDTKDVAGGTIVRDRSAEPTGLLKDNALALVERAIPAPPPEMRDRALEAAMRYVAANGVTSVTSMGS